QVPRPAFSAAGALWSTMDFDPSRTANFARFDLAFPANDTPCRFIGRVYCRRSGVYPGTIGRSPYPCCETGSTTMTIPRHSRRDFLKFSSSASIAGALLPAWLGDLTYGARNAFAAANDRPRVGSIGVG